MTSIEKVAYKLANECQDRPFKRITRAVSSEILSLFDSYRTGFSREEAQLLSYKVDNLIEVFNPEFANDLIFLNKLSKAMSDLVEEKLFINNTLGIPKEC